MASVTLSIGGRSHVVACRDGGEAELMALGKRLDAHAAAASRAAGAPAGERMMLFLALLLADECAELERAPAPAPPGPEPLDMSELADRLEAVAAALEDRGGSA